MATTHTKTTAAHTNSSRQKSQKLWTSQVRRVEPGEDLPGYIRADGRYVEDLLWPGGQDTSHRIRHAERDATIPCFLQKGKTVRQVVRLMRSGGGVRVSSRCRAGF